MPKAAVSVTLERENLRWLEVRQRATRARSLSQTLDDLISTVRETVGAPARARSIVGALAIAEDDPDLSHGDDLVRGLFPGSLPGPGAATRSRPRTGRRRG